MAGLVPASTSNFLNLGKDAAGGENAANFFLAAVSRKKAGRLLFRRSRRSVGGGRAVDAVNAVIFPYLFYARAPDASLLVRIEG
jgi:hypothetical protein